VPGNARDRLRAGHHLSPHTRWRLEPQANKLDRLGSSRYPARIVDADAVPHHSKAAPLGLLTGTLERRPRQLLVAPRPDRSANAAEARPAPVKQLEHVGKLTHGPELIAHSDNACNPGTPATAAGQGGRCHC
jgi:hypothetical protein